jgi:hypothetical protein
VGVIVSVVIVYVALTIFTFVFVWGKPFYMAVAGQVTDNRGKPLAGAEVRAMPRRFDSCPSYIRRRCNITSETTTTDGNGHYRIDDLVGGVQNGDQGYYIQEYTILANAKDYAPRRTRVRSENLPGIFSRKHSNLLGDIDFALDREGSVSGRAVDTRGQPLPGRSIQPVLKNEREDSIHDKVIPDAVRTDAEGRFRFEEMSPGVYSFQVEGYPDAVPSSWRPEVFRAVGREWHFATIPQITQSKPVELAAGQNLEGVEVVFESPADRGNIAGRVVDAASGDAIAEFTVKILRIELPGWGTPVLGRIRSGDKLEQLSPDSRELKGRNGAFRIEDISPGTATLLISSAGYGTTRTAVAVLKGRTVEPTFPLAQESRLRGTAYYRGKPKVAGAALLFPSNQLEDRIVGSHDDKGNYEIRGLPAGEYLVQAGTLISANSQRVVIAVDSAIARLEPGQTTIHDFHFQGTSEIRCDRYEGDELIIQAPQGDPSHPGVAGDYSRFWTKKTFEVIGLPPGTYTLLGRRYAVEIRGPSWLTGETSQTVTIHPGRIERVDLTFAPIESGKRTGGS